MSSPKALICRGTQLSLEDVSIPPLQSHQVLVRNKAVAQNPTDTKSFDLKRYGDGAVLGCDFCGRVERLGAAATRLQKGQRVAGLVWGGPEKGRGAYSTYTVADERFCFRVPEAMASEAAATLPLALTTAWLAFFSPYSLHIDRGKKGEDIQILIWGGSSSVGQYAIQLAKYYGFQFATTCTNTEIVENLGAKHVFNYRSPTVVEDIKQALPGITYVFDCIGSEVSSVQSAETVCDAGGVHCTVAPGKPFASKIEARVKATDVVVWTAFFTEIKYGGFSIPPREEDRDLASELYEKLPELLTDGAIKPNPVRVIDGGLNGVVEGFQLQRDKAISGQKLVYNLEQ